MATYSDDPVQFNKDILDAMNQAILDISSSGGVVEIKKGNFQAKYTSISELRNAITEMETKIYFQENGCRRKC